MMIMFILAICGIVLMVWGIGMYIRMLRQNRNVPQSTSTTAGAGTNHDSRHYLGAWVNKRRRRRENNRNSPIRSTSEDPDADQNVWSVSRQINQVYGPPPNYQWPTHDNHVSLDTFTLRAVNQAMTPPTSLTNDTGGKKVAPPPYSEVELPSYEEVFSEGQHTYESIPTAPRTHIF